MDIKYLLRYKIFLGTSLLLLTNASQSQHISKQEYKNYIRLIFNKDGNPEEKGRVLKNMPEKQIIPQRLTGSYDHKPENDSLAPPVNKDPSGTKKELTECILVTCYEMTALEPLETEPVYVVADEMPEFPGGSGCMQEFINKNLCYPLTQACVSGRVIVSFIIEKDGSLTDPKVVRSLESSFDKEALAVLKKMPRWKPGKHDGMEVRVKLNVPVTFQ